MRGRPRGQTNSANHKAGRPKKPVAMDRGQMRIVDLQGFSSTSESASNETAPEGSREAQGSQLQGTGPFILENETITEDDVTQLQGTGSLMLENEGQEESILLQDHEDPEREIPEHDDDDNDEDMDDTAEYEGDSYLPKHSLTSQYLRNLQIRVSKEQRPQEYKQGTFWVNPPSPFFSLEQIKWSQLYQPRVFLWMPHLLIGDQKLKCKTCNSRSPLNLHGWSSDPYARRVVDIDW